MKVIEDGSVTDRFGKYPIVFKNASIEKINEYLFSHYSGYKFAIIFNECGDEYEPMKDVYVYYLDEVLDEAAEYAGANIFTKDGKPWK